jgi:hypothetical protein
LGLLQIALAGVVYAGFSFYLYEPHFKSFDSWHYLFVVNACGASLGCLLLSRRWVSSFWASFLAGAVYGFGPFMLGLSESHATAGSLAAIVPWLFCPAAFVGRKRRWVGLSLSVLPFLAIVVSFQILAYSRLFPMALQIRLGLADLAGLLATRFAAAQDLTPLGFYHVPLAALMIGLAMLVTARRFGVLTIITIGAVLAFCRPIFSVSPVMWLSLPVLGGSVIIGVGTQALVSAGAGDRKWVLAGAGVSAVLAILTLLLATKCFRIFAGLGNKVAEMFVSAATMYILGGVALAIVFLLARAKVRLQWLRGILLGSAMAVDIFFGAQFIVDSIL